MASARGTAFALAGSAGALSADGAPRPVRRQSEASGEGGRFRKVPVL